MSSFDITIIGDTNVDLLLGGLPEDLPPERELAVEQMAVTLGGSAAITAHNMAALGARVGLITALPEDLFGAFCMEQLHAAGVDLAQRVLSRESTGVTVLLQHTAFRRAFTYPGSAGKLRLADLDVSYLSRSRHFHLSSFFLQRELRDDVPRLFATLKQAGLTISLDTNDDPWDAWSGPIFESLRYVDILMPNEREACRLAGVTDIALAIDILRRAVPTLVVKRAAQGAVVLHGDERLALPAIPVTPRDAVGAGDSFNAGFLYGYLNRQPLARCLELGNLAGAYSTTQAGGTAAFRNRAGRQSFFAANAQDSRLLAQQDPA
ncbi:MAG: carbohydrate kinase family protein [Acidobacteriaceae bacterium]